MRFLDSVYTCCQDDPDQALDLIFDSIDDLLLAERFDDVAGILDLVDVHRLDIISMIGFLSITLCIKDRIPDSRARFVTIVERRLEEIAPERMNRLLSGLR